jgi:hypothetical protein
MSGAVVMTFDSQQRFSPAAGAYPPRSCYGNRLAGPFACDESQNTIALHEAYQMLIQKTCPQCGRIFFAKPSRPKHCSRSCAMRSKGITPEHYPTLNYHHAHRTVMELKLGRKLARWEWVHHNNDDRHDYSIDNLELVTLSQHNTIHKTKHIGCVVPGCQRKHNCHGLCAVHAERARRRGILYDLGRAIETKTLNQAMIQAVESGAMLA